MKVLYVFFILFLALNFQIAYAQLPGGVTLSTSECNVVTDGEFSAPGAWVNKATISGGNASFTSNQASLEQNLAGLTTSSISLRFKITYTNTSSSVPANFYVKLNGITYVTFLGNNALTGTVSTSNSATCTPNFGLIPAVETLFTLTIPNLLSQGVLNFSISGGDNYSIDDVSIVGICDHLFWLRADLGTSTVLNNASLAQWDDQGALGLHVSSIIDYQPRFIENGANFNPSINFSTTNDFLERSNVQSNFIKTNNTNSGFVVANINNTSSMVMVYNQGNNTGKTRNGIGRTRSRFNVNTPLYTIAAPINKYNLITQIVNPLGRNFYLDGGINGSAATSESQTTVSRITIGRSTANIFGSSDLIGNVSEIVNFKRNLTNQEREKVDTYLAIKYGISLSHNYINGMGDEIYASDGSGTVIGFDKGIFGIGYEVLNGGLDQRISKSSEETSLVTIVNGTFTATSITKNKDGIALVNNQYLLMGHNGGSLIFNQFQAPVGKSILDRKWKVKNTGGVGAISIQVLDAVNSGKITLPPAIDNSVDLIVKSGSSDFSSGASVYPMTYDFINKVWKIPSITLSTDDYFTFQTVLRTSSSGCIISYNCEGVFNGTFASALLPSWTGTGWTLGSNSTTMDVNNINDQEINQSIKNLDPLMTNIPLKFSLGFKDDSSTIPITLKVRFGGVVYLTITAPLFGNSFVLSNYVLSNGASWGSPPIDGSLTNASFLSMTLNIPFAVGVTGGNLSFSATTIGSNDDWFLDDISVLTSNCNALWLKADRGTSTSTDATSFSSWTSNANDNTIMTSLGTPTYNTVGINFNPSITFDSSTDLFTNAIPIIDCNRSNFTLLGVFQPAVLNTNYSLLTQNTNAPNFGTLSTLATTTTSGPVLNPAPIIELSTVVKTELGSLMQRRLGASGTPGAYTLAQPSNLQIGTTTTRGKYGEIIVFKKELQQSDYEKIESYLAIKWGITLVHNYLDGQGRVVYDKVTFANDITGIGREDCQELHQRQSKSVNISALVTFGNNNIIATTNAATNANDILSDQSYLIAGDNGNAVTFTDPVLDPNSSASVMLAKKWKIQETGNIGSVLISIPDNANSNLAKLPSLTSSQALYLIVDNDGDFSNGTSQFQMKKVGSGSSTCWELQYDYPIQISYFTFGIVEICTTVTECDDATSWDGVSWSNGFPNSSLEVVFLANFDSNSNGSVLSACEVLINTGVTVIFKGNDVLDIQGNLTNKGTLIVENNASLIQRKNDAFAIGEITLKRNSREMVQYDYSYWSSPVNNQSLYNLSPNTLFDKYFSFDPAINNWKEHINGTTIMLPGVGYIVRAPQSFTATPVQFLASFTGPLFTGTKSITVTKGASEWNLIGNPYPSALDINLFLNNPKNSSLLGGTIYLWTHNTPIAANEYSSGDYASYNKLGGVSTGASPAPLGKIASGQAFFVEALATGVVSFNNCMRSTTAGSNSQFYKFSNSNLDQGKLWLELKNTQGAYKQLLIGYTPGATLGIDRDYDGTNFNGNQFIDFYSVANDKFWVIQGRPMPFDISDEVVMGYQTSIEGEFTIGISQVEGFLNNHPIFLLDKEKGIYHDLKVAPYSFRTTIGTFNSRFKLVYADLTLGSDSFEKNGIVILYKNGILHLESLGTNIRKVEVFDLLGRRLFSNAKYNDSIIMIKEAKKRQKQFVIVKVTLIDNRVITKKMMF
jgi:hypothetical protein